MSWLDVRPLLAALLVMNDVNAELVFLEILSSRGLSVFFVAILVVFFGLLLSLDSFPLVTVVALASARASFWGSLCALLSRLSAWQGELSVFVELWTSFDSFRVEFRSTVDGVDFAVSSRLLGFFAASSRLLVWPLVSSARPLLGVFGAFSLDSWPRSCWCCSQMSSGRGPRVAP